MFSGQVFQPQPGSTVAVSTSSPLLRREVRPPFLFWGYANLLCSMPEPGVETVSTKQYLNAKDSLLGLTLDPHAKNGQNFGAHGKQAPASGRLGKQIPQLL